METIAAAGHRIAYERRSEGPPVVLLHGYVGDRRTWRRQLDELSDEFTVVAWDAPGYGASSDPPESFGMDDFADCLAAFIDGVGLGRPHVVGLSFGDGLALELYRRHPAVPRTLVLSAPRELVDEFAASMAEFHPVGLRAGPWTWRAGSTPRFRGPAAGGDGGRRPRVQRRGPRALQRRGPRLPASGRRRRWRSRRRMKSAGAPAATASGWPACCWEPVRWTLLLPRLKNGSPVPLPAA